MILFYNRQASTGIRAEPKDVIACIKRRRVDVLKEQQIRSWRSIYHQKRKRSLNTLTSEGRTLQSATPTPTEQPTSVPTSTLLISHAATQTVAGASSFQPASIHVPTTIVPVTQTTHPHVSVASNSIPSTSPVGATVTQAIQTSGVSVAPTSIPSMCPVTQTIRPSGVSVAPTSIPSVCPVTQTIQNQV